MPVYVEFRAMQTYMDAAKVSFLEGVNVVEVEVASFAEGMDRLMNGSLDLAMNTTTTPAAYELEASPHGIGWLELPKSDTENWEKYQKVAPFFSPVLATSGAGVSEENPLQTVGFSDRWLAYAWQDEDFVYWFMTELEKTIPQARDKHKYLASWSLENAINLDEAISPFHPGAIRFYKERGMWGETEEAWQAETLANEERRISEWKAEHPDWTYNDFSK